MQTQINFPIHPHSIEVYRNKIEPTISDRKKAVLDVLKIIGPSTCHDVARYMGVPTHTVSGRFSELKKMGLIKENGFKIINGSKHTILEIV